MNRSIIGIGLDDLYVRSIISTDLLNRLSTLVPVSGKRLHDIIRIHTHTYSIIAKSSVDRLQAIEFIQQYCSCLCIIP